MRAWIAAVLLLLAGACQPIPHPFADDVNRPSMPALRPPDSVGIFVVSPAGAPQPASAALGEALAHSLLASDVPASTDAQNRASYRLETSAAEETIAPGQARVTLSWNLKAANGKALGHGTAAQVAPAAAWVAGDQKLAAALADAVAPEIADLVSSDAPAPATVTPVVALREVDGAPGDGGPALARAMSNELQRAGLDVGGADAKARFFLTCDVTLGPAQAGKQLVTVRWRLALAEGKPLGEVSQQNNVPAGSLDGTWGEVALAVAGAAAPGIAQLIDQAQNAAAGG